MLLLATLVTGCETPGNAPTTESAIALDPSVSIEVQLDTLRAEAERLNLQGQLHEAEEVLQNAVRLAEDGLPGEPGCLATLLNPLSDILFKQGAFERQEAVLWQALEAATHLDDPAEAAAAWNNLGVSFAAQGRPSAALAAYQQSLELRQDPDSATPPSPALRHNLGVQLLLLGRVDEGIEALSEAIAADRVAGEPVALGQRLPSLAWGLALAGRHREAQDVYDEAVTVLQSAEAPHDLAIALEQRAQLHRAEGRLDEAYDDLQRARELIDVDNSELLFDVAYLELGLGAVEREQMEFDSLAPEQERTKALDTARERLERAVALFDQLKAHEGRVLARVELARTLDALKGPSDLTASTLEEAVEIVEAARADLRLASLRATYLGGWQTVYRELIDQLARRALAAQQAGAPEAQDLARQALEVAERARARALLDRLAAPDHSPTSASGTEALRDTVEQLEHQAVLDRTREALAGEPTARRTVGAQVAERRAALRRARLALEHAEEVASRELPPSPVATPASIESVQRLLAATESEAPTVLLVVALGEPQSWLWQVEAGSVTLTPLPSGAKLEALARNAHQLLPRIEQRGFGRAARSALEQLASWVLRPITSTLQTEEPLRVAIVPDGALHLVPWGVLPNPAADRSEVPEPLINRHEVVHLPSASTLVALRQRSGRLPARKWITLIADPVFEADDPRLVGSTDEVSAATSSPAHDLRRVLGNPLVRLPATAMEVETIADLVHQATGVRPPLQVGFDARRELLTHGQLDDSRILHLATHGLVDADDPALAGLVLSLFDAQGQSIDGLLRARDLHGLDLASDLVVLSACRTALGQEIRGEGLVGLADGFFAAGARHLVVSLWDVDDQATAELMTRFYRHLLLEGRTPGEALRRAQDELRTETPWRSEADWAAFVAVGDWAVSVDPP